MESLSPLEEAIFRVGSERKSFTTLDLKIITGSIIEDIAMAIRILERRGLISEVPSEHFSNWRILTPEEIVACKNKN